MELFFQFLIDKWQALYVTFIVRPYERAVHIRSGKLLRVCKPGWYWKLPLEIDEIHKVNIVSTTENLPTQVVTTADDLTYVVGVVVRWRVREEAVAKLVIDLEDHVDVLRDTIIGMVAQEFIKADSEVPLEKLQSNILEATRRRLGRFGFDIEDLYVTDISEARTFRLVQGDS